jgi:hypothetical protein
MSNTDAFWRLLSGCEVKDVVLHDDGSKEERLQNEAANAELARRGGSDRFGGLHPSGEVPPDTVIWIDTCSGKELDLP